MTSSSIIRSRTRLVACLGLVFILLFASCLGTPLQTKIGLPCGEAFASDTKVEETTEPEPALPPDCSGARPGSKIR